MPQTAEDIAADTAAAEAAARATAEAEANAIIRQRAADKAAADKVKADQLAADQAEADKTTAALAPFTSTLDALTVSGRISVARRKELEAAIIQGKTADLLLLKLADDPPGNKEKTGAQTGGGKLNPVGDWVDRTYGKKE